MISLFISALKRYNVDKYMDCIIYVCMIKTTNVAFYEKVFVVYKRNVRDKMKRLINETLTSSSKYVRFVIRMRSSFKRIYARHVI